MFACMIHRRRKSVPKDLTKEYPFLSLSAFLCSVYVWLCIAAILIRNMISVCVCVCAHRADRDKHIEAKESERERGGIYKSEIVSN